MATGTRRGIIHVLDVIEGLWRLAQTDTPVGIWNVASGRRTAVASLARLDDLTVGRPLERTFSARRPGDVTRSASSPARLKRLGWRPTIRLSQGIIKLAELRAPARESSR